MIEEVGEIFEGLFEHFRARQVHDTEVVGLSPVEAAAARDQNLDRKSTRLNSSHEIPSRMPSSA